MYRLICRAALVVATLLAVLAVPMQAHASSDYDGTMATTDRLHLRSSTQSCLEKNYTLSWTSILLDTESWDDSWGQYLFDATSTASIAAFNDAVSNGGSWAVSQGNFNPGSSNGGGGAIFDDTINVQFAASTTAYVDFGTIGSHTYAYMKTTDSSYVYNVRLSFYKPTSGPNAGTCVPIVNQSARWTGDKTITWINNNLGGQNFSIATDWQAQDSGFVTTANPLFINADISYPSGYEGVEVPSTYSPPAVKYVAMGDSFSSGEGNSPFESGTDSDGVNECHRSEQAYPRILSNNSNLNLWPMEFVACSGATTANVLSGGTSEGSWGEDPQVDVLSSATEVVTLTVGGNDAGFQEYLQGCVVAPCGPSTITYDAMMDLIDSSSFLSNLETTYEEILDNATAADVYVIDYPYLTADNAGYCGMIDFSGARDIQVALNSTIALAVADVRGVSTDYSNRLHYVSTNYTGSPFNGQHLCNGGTSDFGSTTFHPNALGQSHYADVVAAAID